MRCRIFTILLAKLGHEVTGIDLTPDMIRHSRELAKEEKVSCTFKVMDGEKLDFKSGSLMWLFPEILHGPCRMQREHTGNGSGS